jgi:hypothetical protein
MKVKDLKPNFSVFGNKGNVWSNTAHIYKSGHGNLCGTPALSTNWARLEGLETVGCPQCLKLYAEQEKEECGHRNRYVAVRHESGLAVHRCRDCGQRC